MAIEIPNKILAFATSDKNGIGRSAGCTFAALGGGQYEITLERDAFNVGAPEASNVLWLATRTDGPGWAHFAPTSPRVGVLTVQTLAPASVVGSATIGSAVEAITTTGGSFVDGVSLSAASGTSSAAVTSVDFVGQTTTTANFIDSFTQGTLATSLANAVTSIGTSTTNVVTGFDPGSAASLPAPDSASWSIVFFQFPGT